MSLWTSAVNILTDIKSQSCKQEDTQSMTTGKKGMNFNSYLQETNCNELIS